MERVTKVSVKEEYESKNGEKHLPEITIENDSYINKMDLENVIEKIYNNETVYFFMGDKTCRRCRKVIGEIASASAEAEKNVCYVALRNEAGEEVIRDNLIIDDDGRVSIQKTPHADAYKKLKELCKGIGAVSEKRLYLHKEKICEIDNEIIYAPVMLKFENGKCVDMIDFFADDLHEELMEFLGV